jgi:hypothetical protein
MALEFEELLRPDLRQLLGFEVNSEITVTRHSIDSLLIPRITVGLR